MRPLGTSVCLSPEQAPSRCGEGPGTKCAPLHPNVAATARALYTSCGCQVRSSDLRPTANSGPAEPPTGPRPACPFRPCPVPEPAVLGSPPPVTPRFPMLLHPRPSQHLGRPGAASARQRGALGGAQAQLAPGGPCMCGASSLLPDSRRAAITVLEDTQPPLQALFLSGRGGVRAPGVADVVLVLLRPREAPGEAAPGPRASPPPGPPRAQRGAGCPGRDSGPSLGPRTRPRVSSVSARALALGTDRAAVASISLRGAIHPSKPTPWPPAQRAVPAPTFLLLTGGHELGCHE